MVINYTHWCHNHNIKKVLIIELGGFDQSKYSKYNLFIRKKTIFTPDVTWYYVRIFPTMSHLRSI